MHEQQHEARGARKPPRRDPQFALAPLHGVGIVYQAAVRAVQHLVDAAQRSGCARFEARQQPLLHHAEQVCPIVKAIERGREGFARGLSDALARLRPELENARGAQTGQ